jgi:hypothetical protein
MDITPCKKNNTSSESLLNDINATLEKNKKEFITLSKQNKTYINKPTYSVEFTSFEFLLEHFSEEQLRILQLKYTNVQDNLLALARYQGFGKKELVNVVKGMVEELEKEKI